MPPQEINKSKEQAEFENLIRAANIHRRRGDYTAATVAIKQALEINPDDPEAREFAADMLFAHGLLEKAADQYKQLFEEDKSRASAEEKYAKAIIQISEGVRQQDLLKEMLENPEKFRTPSRNPLLASIVSLAPGFGHIYCGQLIKGIVLLVSTFICWTFFLLLLPDVSGFPAQERFVQLTKNISGLAIVFLVIALILHFYALVDASVVAGKMRENQQAKNMTDTE